MRLRPSCCQDSLRDRILGDLALARTALKLMLAWRLLRTVKQIIQIYRLSCFTAFAMGLKISTLKDVKLILNADPNFRLCTDSVI